MKFILSFFLLIPSITFCQYNSKDTLEYSCFAIGVAKNYNALNVGTCFFVNYKAKYFLVSNYHIITNNDDFFESKPLPKSQTPNVIVVNFIDKQKKVVPKVWLLENSSGKKLYKIPKRDSSHRQLDLAFFQINKDSLPKNIPIYIIKADEVSEPINLDSNTKVFACGFRGNESFNIKYPLIDTLYTVTKYAIGNTYIIATGVPTLHGSSGGTVFIKYNDKLTIVGVVSSETTQLSFLTIPEFFYTDPSKTNFGFISFNTVRQQLDELFFNGKN